MKIRPVRWKSLWCQHCCHRTDQECLPDVQAEGGLLWRCERCLQSAVKSAFDAERG
jgi:hypothetical protein